MASSRSKSFDLEDSELDESEQPDEPSWDALLSALESAQSWLTSEDGLDELDCIIRTEAIDLAWAMIRGSKSGKSCDELAREFFQTVNRVAFWVAGNIENEDLREWIARFCVEPQAEWQRMRTIDALASVKGEA